MLRSARRPGPCPLSPARTQAAYLGCAHQAALGRFALPTPHCQEDMSETQTKQNLQSAMGPHIGGEVRPSPSMLASLLPNRLFYRHTVLIQSTAHFTHTSKQHIHFH